MRRARQAFGAGNLSAMSLILQRALILSCSLSLVVWAAWTQLPVLLPLLGACLKRPAAGYATGLGGGYVPYPRLLSAFGIVSTSLHVACMQAAACVRAVGASPVRHV